MVMSLAPLQLNIAKNKGLKIKGDFLGKIGGYGINLCVSRDFRTDTLSTDNER